MAHAVGMSMTVVASQGKQVGYVLPLSGLDECEREGLLPHCLDEKKGLW